MQGGELTEEEFEKFCAMIYEIAGIRIPGSKTGDDRQPAPKTATRHGDRDLLRLLSLPDVADRPRGDAAFSQRDHHERDLFLSRRSPF